MRILIDGGFVLAARVSRQRGVFKVEWRAQRALGPCIYVYVQEGCPIYVGHGKTLGSRINGECSWLNGTRPSEIQRRRWIEKLGACKQVEVWAKPSSNDLPSREEEEERWIDLLNSPYLLNVRRRRKAA